MHQCGLECWPLFFPPSYLLLQLARLSNAYYFASFVEILHWLRDTSQTLGGVCPRGNGRLPLQRLALSHFATFWEFHYAPHRAQHTLANDEGTYVVFTRAYLHMKKSVRNDVRLITPPYRLLNANSMHMAHFGGKWAGLAAPKRPPGF